MAYRRWAALGAIVATAALSAADAQETPAGTPPARVRPYKPRIAGGAMESDRFRSTLVRTGGAIDQLLYEPKALVNGGRVAIVYANRRFDFGPPAIELASRGYRVLHVSAPPAAARSASTPYDDFVEVSKGIAYLRALPGVRKVVVAGWGAGAATITLYAAIAEKGAGVCNHPGVIYPCTPAQASGLARPDGLILFDPGLGSGSKVGTLDPGRPDLDPEAAANGYDAATDTARFPDAFRRGYFAAEAARNGQIVDAAVARLGALGGPAGVADEPMPPGTTSHPGGLSGIDLSLLSRTKRPHLLLKADGTTAQAVLRSIRPTLSALPGPPPLKPGEQPRPPRVQSLRDFLANDAIRARPDFALTEDDVRGVDWASSNLGTPAQAESVTVPALLLTNTCFQFVTSAEIVLDHLASKDKTQVGIEGSEHEFTPCRPEFGDTKTRLFDHTAAWLGKPGRF